MFCLFKLIVKPFGLMTCKDNNILFNLVWNDCILTTAPSVYQSWTGYKLCMSCCQGTILYALSLIEIMYNIFCWRLNVPPLLCAAAVDGLAA